VFYYSVRLFEAAGLPPSTAKYATIGVGVVMVVMTLVSIPLMDRAGRRTLHLYGLGGMFIFSIFITISLLVKAALGNYTFLPFTLLLGFFWTFTYKKVPETKNRTFEEISALFRRDDVVSINGMGTRRNSLAPGQDAVYEEKPETSICIHPMAVSF
ncbi:hypothetical protein V5799_014151, partial [Amblyomma americanum]